MNNAELDKVLASMDAVVRRAYALGRKEALDQLVSYCRSDEVAPPPLALAGPDASFGADAHAPAAEPDLPPPTANDDDRDAERHRVAPGRNGSGGGGITGAILDFVYPSKRG